MKRFRSFSPSAAMIVVIAVVLVVNNVFDRKQFLKPKSIIAWDVINFYSYLPATFVEHDLTLSFVRNDMQHYFCGDYYWPEILPDSTMLIKTTMGLSMLYCPFFLVAHALAAPLGYAADGFSPPYALALVLACVFWVIVGCVFLRKVLLRHFPEWVTAIVIGVTVFATNLFWYSTHEAAYSHGFLFGLISVFLYQTVRWHEKPTWWGSVFVGLNVGLIALVRPTDVLVLLFFLLYGVTSWKDVGRKVGIYLHHLPMMAVMALAAFAVWVPQMLYWHSMTGSWLFYSYTSNEHFFWTQPKLIEGIFGFRKGWLVYTPVMIFAILGFIPLFKRYRQFFYGIMVFLVLDLYVLMCWWCWWFGGCFGQRSMVDCYGLLAVPMAAFVEWMFSCRKVKRAMLVTLFSAVTYLSFFHYKQYKHQAIHYEAMTREAYFESFGHQYPSDRFWDLLDWPDYEAAKEGIR